jgi:hypothetical protein
MWKQPSVAEWMSKLDHLDGGKTWRNFKHILLSKTGQSENTHTGTPPIWYLEKAKLGRWRSVVARG